MQSKEEFWEVAGFVSELMPVVVRCDTDAWKSYFDDYTLMDAVLISRSDLQVFIVLPFNYAFDPFFFSECAQVKIKP